MPSDRSLQTVAAIDPNEVPPGSVGMTLASGRPGIMTSDGEIAVDARESLTAYDQRQQFLAMARKRWRQSADCESELRKDMLDDLRFYNAEQWPDNIKMDRVLDGRPCLTINRLPQFVRQVLNQARQMRPAIQYNPIDGGADVDTAEVLQGIARSIERQSNAPMHYTQASEHQIVIGRGWLRVRADWLAPDSFEQEILIESMEDPFIVYPDPASGKADGSDLNWCFLIARVPWYEYHTQYPRAERASMYDWTSVGDEEAQWVDETGVLVAEYYYIELVKAELVEVALQMGEESMVVTLYADALRPEDTRPGPNGEPPKLTVRRRRETLRRQLKWAKINGIEILEGNADHTAGRDLPGRYIPLIPICGEKLVVNGERNLRGMVRDAKDPQRTYNFWVSAETEMIALAPRAPVIGAVGQFETTKEQWLMANRRNFPFLEYDPVDINGNLVPAPQRNAFDPNIVPIIQATQQADQDLKSVIGMFDASQEHSREQSGKAILARQAQGEQGTSHFLHNQSLSIQHIGRILLDWIPIYYDSPRIVRIIGLDDNERDVLVHAGNPEAAAQLQQQQPQNSSLATTLQSGALYDLNLGRYDVSVSVAPSFQSRRAEAVESMTQLLQAFPLAAPYALDVIAKNMDWPGARELAERFKHLVPAEARDDANNPLPPAAKQQLGQMQQQLQLAGQQIQEQQKIIDTKRTEQQGLAQIRQLELQSNERLAQLKADADLQKIQAQGRVDQQLQLLESRLEHINQQAEFLHERRMQLDAPEPAAKPQGPAARPTRPVSESLNYKDAPPDIRRQIEQQAGLQPSAMGALELAERRAKAIPKAAGPAGPTAPAAPATRPPVLLGRRPPAAKAKRRPTP